MFCPECGNENKDDANFCISCGYKINDSKVTSNNSSTDIEKHNVHKSIKLTSKKFILLFVILIGLVTFVIYYVQEQAKIDKIVSQMQTLESKWMRWHDIYNSNYTSCANAIYRYASNSEHKRESDKCIRKAKSIALSSTQYSKKGFIEAKINKFKELKNTQYTLYIKRKLNSINHNIDGSYYLNKDF